MTSIFLNTRLGFLEENPSEDGESLIKCEKVMLGSDIYKLLTGPPIRKHIPVPYYTRFDNASRELMEICGKHINKAKEGFAKSPLRKKDKSVLEKLIE